jgi:hypothetical protein
MPDDRHPYHGTGQVGQPPDADVSTRKQIAAFILREAAALGISVGTDGAELVMLAPLRISFTRRRIFEIALEEYRAEIIAHIEAENCHAVAPEARS